MFCSKCGKEIKEGKFCSYCGNLLPDMEENIQEQLKVNHTKEKRGNKVKKFLLTLFLVCICILGIVAAIYFKDIKSDKFKMLIDSGAYSEAVTYYRDNIIGHNSQEEIVQKYAQENVDKLVEQYFADKLLYEEVTVLLGHYGEIVPSKTETASEEVEKLYASKNIFLDAQKSLQESKYDVAQEQYSKVIEQDSNYNEAQEKIKECYEKRKNALLESIANIVATGEYKNALDEINKASSFILEEDKTQIEQIRTDVKAQYQSNVFSMVDSMIIEADYRAAFDEIEAIAKVLGNTEAIVEKKASTIALFESYVQEKVNNYKKSKQFQEAMSFVREAQVILENSEALEAMLSDLQEYIPVLLADIYVFEDELDGYIDDEKYQKDTYQNEYANVMQYSLRGYDYGGYQVYLLNGEYQHFSAILAPAERWESDKNVAITIYGDDVKLYEGNLTRESKPQTIELNIVGIEKLKISFEKYYYSGAYVLLGEPNLYKKY